MRNDIIVADDLVYRDDSDRAMTTSLVVAAKFGMRHDNVLAKIKVVISDSDDPDWAALNFQGGSYPDMQGQDRPLFCMTEEGFSILAMGFTGREALRWKKAFYRAFAAMRETLMEACSTAIDIRGSIETMLLRVTDVLTQSTLATNVKVDAVRSEVNDVRGEVRQVDAKVNRLTEVVTSFAEHANQRRRRIADSTKQQHRAVLARRGWSCPCCNRMQVPNGFEFDHFFACSLADFDHTWPLCKPCHLPLSTGQRARGEVRSDFDAYQAFAKRELPWQSKLF